MIGAIHRFLDENYLTSSNTTPSEVAAGQLTNATKTISSGGAAGSPTGTYTGLTERQWIVKISSVSGGTSIGQSQYIFSSDGGQTYSSAATTAGSVVLAFGVSFSFTAAISGPDFALNDEWRFKTLLPHGVSAMLDFQDRNLYYESVDDANEVVFTIDLGVNRVVRAFALVDHNLSETAVITLKGNTTPVFGSPAIDVTPTYSSPSFVKFISGTGTAASLPASCRYWRVGITDVDNADGKIRIGKMYLGQYKQILSRATTILPYQPDQLKNGFNIESSRGFRRESVEATRQRHPLVFHRINTADKNVLMAMKDNVWNVTQKLHIPLIWVPDHRDTATLYVCWLDSFGPPALTNRVPSLTDGYKYTVPMTLLEVVKL
jgi:hypothetical protein